MVSRGTAKRARVALVPADGAPGHMPDIGLSLLRMSVAARLGLAAVAACVLWLAVLWAIA